MQKYIKISLILIAYQIIIFFWGKYWLTDIMPPNDFAGTVAVVSEMHDSVVNFDFSNWSPRRFCGSTNAILGGSLNWNIIGYLPFTLFFSIEQSIKIAVLFYLGLAGASMFWLCNLLTKQALLSFWAGLAYMICPVFVFPLCTAGHINLAPFFAVLPIIFLSLWRLCEQPGLRHLFWAAVFIILGIWIDAERAFTSLPFLYLFFLIKDGLPNKNTVGTWSIRTAWLIGAGLLAFLLGAFFIIPMTLDGRNLAFFPEPILQSCREMFGMNNMLYLIDRNGWLMSKLAPYLPDRDRADTGNYYLGLSILVLAGSFFLTKKKIGYLRWLPGLGLILLGAIWSASGIYSLHENFSGQMYTLYHHLTYADDHPYLLPAVFVALAGIVILLLYLRHKLHFPATSSLKLTLIIGLLLAVFYLPLFRLLSLTSLYSHMRNPGYFMSALPPLVLTLAATIMVHHFSRNWKKQNYTILIAALIGLTLLDYYPYRKCFQKHEPEQKISELRQIAQIMDNSDLPGRFLARESYNPLTDMLIHLSQRDSAWYWLNWSCPKATHWTFMQQIYPRLHKPETLEQALKLAGIFQVRFLVYDLTQGPPPADTDNLQNLFSGKMYALYENRLCRERIQNYPLPNQVPDSLTELSQLEQVPPEDISAVYSRSQDHISLNLTLTQPRLLVLSQSYYPGWSVTINDKPEPLHSIAETLPALTLLAGEHHLEFSYRRPWYFYGSAALSLLTLATMIYLIIKKTSGRTA